MNAYAHAHAHAKDGAREPHLQPENPVRRCLSERAARAAVPVAHQFAVRQPAVREGVSVLCVFYVLLVFFFQFPC